MRETPRARRHEADGKPPRRTEKAGAHIPSFARRFLPDSVHTYRPVFWVIHSGRAEYVLEYSVGGKPVDRKPSGTYVADVNKGNE
jgi:hypothetical protein